MATTSRPSDTLRRAMRADGRSLHELARQSGVDVTVLSRFGNGIRTLSQASSDALAMTLGLELRPVRSKATRKRGAR